MKNFPDALCNALRMPVGGAGYTAFLAKFRHPRNGLPIATVGAESTGRRLAVCRQPASATGSADANQHLRLKRASPLRKQSKEL